ncbi:hypothetical protein ABW20_dc0104209 [Dactylellina cionopaga]|nr:hypothetical protein ABW20_dc0104209 [Dactylellina cionopaga]
MNPRTAAPNKSIWRDLNEKSFRTHLVHLEQLTNAVPADPQVFSIPAGPPCPSYSIPIRDEQRLADAFAFLAAVEQGAQSVAAVCLEENAEDRNLTVRFAAVDAIHESLQRSLDLVRDVLVKAAAADNDDQLEFLFDLIVSLHHRRLIARLRSSKWEKPKENDSRNFVEASLKSLSKLYEQFETTSPAEELSQLKELVHASYKLCTSEPTQHYAHRLMNVGPTPKVRSAIKTLRQIEKIAAYYRVTRTLLQTSGTYLKTFQHLDFKYLSPYSSVSTSVGYEDWAKTCHVHAEIQLIVYYDLHRSNFQGSISPPRVIGTSKYLCYLCYLFIKAHGSYPPANTHGRLYDQWTVPDLAEFDDKQRQKYRDILSVMDGEVTAEAEKPSLWRTEPMTSRENLLDMMQESPHSDTLIPTIVDT